MEAEQKDYSESLMSLMCMSEEYLAIQEEAERTRERVDALIASGDSKEALRLMIEVDKIMLKYTTYQSRLVVELLYHYAPAFQVPKEVQ